MTIKKYYLRSEKEEKNVCTKKELCMRVLNEDCVIDSGNLTIEWEFLDIQNRFPFMQEKVFSHVSNRLLSKYDFWHKNGEIRLSYFVDLLVQAREIVIKAREYHDCLPAYCSGLVVFPNNLKDEIAITPNNQGKLSIKLLSDI